MHSSEDEDTREFYPNKKRINQSKSTKESRKPIIDDIDPLVVNVEYLLETPFQVELMGKSR